MNKTIESIPIDIDKLFEEGKVVSEDNLKSFVDNISTLLRDRLARNLNKEEQKPSIRMSKLGTPNRKLWYEFNLPQEKASPKNALKFIYGDIIEQLVLFLLKEAGHTVTNEQKEVVIDGIVGHTDGNVDDYATDVKSASSFAFRKFLNATLHKDDPFGYVAQLSAYAKADNNTKAAFIAVNKESGEIVILKLHEIDMIDPEARIREIKQVVALPFAPDKKCYEPEPYGTSGNKTLNKNCNYCPFKELCWKDSNGGKGLRRFRYASGIVNFTEVLNAPRVEEIINIIDLKDAEE